MTELFIDGYGQLSAISSVLGGLAFAAAAALLSVAVGTSRRDALHPAAKLTVASSLASSVLLVLAALAWSFMAADTTRLVAGGDIDGMGAVHEFNHIPSLSLIAGLFLFFISIGASGWIASRLLGVISSLCAVAGMAGTTILLVRFAN